MRLDKSFFLPYQRRWLVDNSRLKIVEKSRRVGYTFVQAYEDVRDAAKAQGGCDVWFSSADESAAKEYILYCQSWAKILKIGGDALGEEVLDHQGAKTFSITFASGNRINALSSNTKAFRSKGGKVVLDEFAFHQDQEGLWKAALPVITWGYPMRILSTYNGQGNRYYRLVEEAKRGNDWSLHSTTIVQAVEDGLADRICQRNLTREEKRQWLAELRETVGDEETWRQEYLCEPVDSATAYLPWDLIASVEHPHAGIPRLYIPGPNRCYVGVDIARRRDLSVLWVVEQVGDVLWTREVVALQGATFEQQESHFARLLANYRVARACLDQTGMGEQFVERAKSSFGSKVEGVLFTGPVKLDLAQAVKSRLEDRQVRIPAEKAVRESLHSVRRTVTAAGNVRFDADRNEVGHGDYFWALALAIHAAGSGYVPIEFQTTGHAGIAAQFTHWDL